MFSRCKYPLSYNWVHYFHDTPVAMSCWRVLKVLRISRTLLRIKLNFTVQNHGNHNKTVPCHISSLTHGTEIVTCTLQMVVCVCFSYQKNTSNLTNPLLHREMNYHTLEWQMVSVMFLPTVNFIGAFLLFQQRKWLQSGSY